MPLRIALAFALALPAWAAADWQSCATALGTVRADATTAQREADAAVRGERELEAARREFDNCRVSSRDAQSDGCRTQKQQFDSRESALQAQVRTLQLQLTILDRSVSGAGLACGKSMRLLPVTPQPAK